MFAIDYDGTIADTNAAKTLWIREHLGLVVPGHQCNRTACAPIIGLDAYERMSKEVYGEEMTLAAGPVPGAGAALEALASMGAVYVLSARREELLQYSLEWLRTRGWDRFIADAVPAPAASKVAIALELGCPVLVDDDARHLKPPADDEMLLLHLQTGIEDAPASREGVVVCADW